VIAGIVALSASLSADYKDAYRRGVQARNRENWAEAARLFRQAVQEQPNETGEPINLSGAEFEPYLPQYHLGLALYNMQDCPGALAAWDNSQRSGAVLKSRFADLYRRARFDCEGRKVHQVPAPAPQPPAKAPVDPRVLYAAVTHADDAIAAADRADAAVRQLMTDPALGADWPQRADVVAAQTRAEQFLTDARASYDSAKQESDVKTLNTVATIAAGAEQQLDILRQTAQARKTQLEERAREAAKPVAVAENVPATAPAAVTPAPAALQLVPLIESFTEGRYRDVATMARQMREVTGTDGAHAALFGAAANYMLFLRGGERDRALRDAAADYAQRCRRLDPAVRPDSRLFSPKFTAFFSAQK
jgi:hypothetical protein